MAKNAGLTKSLTLFPTTAIVIGSVIGSGIFVSSAGMARELLSGPLLILVWALGGLITLFGALSLSYLARQYPTTGGMYEYFTQIYGERVGFLYGWANFMIAGTGAAAAISFIFASYVGEFFDLPRLPEAWEKIPLDLGIGILYPFDQIGVKLVGAVPILFSTALNVRGIRLGALYQSISTSTKVVAILAIIAAAFLVGSRSGPIETIPFAVPAGSLQGWALIAAIVTALSSAFWSYDGWANVTCIAGEVKDPVKTVPRAILLGSLTFVGIYVLLNLAYLTLLPIEAIAQAPQDRVASLAISQVFGRGGAIVIALLIIFSTADTINATLLTNGRVYYAMAGKGAWFPSAAIAHPQYHTPHRALIQQGTWALILLFTGTFDLVASMYVFTNWVLYVLLAAGVFLSSRRSKKKSKHEARYLLVAGLFLLFASLYVGLTLVSDIRAFSSGKDPVIRSLMGMALVLAGLPFYFYFKKKRTKRSK